MCFLFYLEHNSNINYPPRLFQFPRHKDARALITSSPPPSLPSFPYRHAQDLESVQKLLLEKTSQREDEDVLLFDAAQVVAQRRKSVRGGGGRGQSPADGARAATGGGGWENAGEEQWEQEEGLLDSSAYRPRRVRKFENTGWFHSYE